jgi:hypothetical protein
MGLECVADVLVIPIGAFYKGGPTISAQQARSCSSSCCRTPVLWTAYEQRAHLYRMVKLWVKPTHEHPETDMDTKIITVYYLLWENQIKTMR